MTRRSRNTSLEPYVDPGPPGDWAKRASCRMALWGNLNFFGKKRTDWATSKQVCVGCPVRRDCLEYALDARSVEGVWGGLDPLELRYALGRDASGALWTYTRSDVKCPFCRGATESVEQTDNLSMRKCETCGFSWVRAERHKPKRVRKAKA